MSRKLQLFFQLLIGIFLLWWVLSSTTYLIILFSLADFCSCLKKINYWKWRAVGRTSIRIPELQLHWINISNHSLLILQKIWNKWKKCSQKFCSHVCHVSNPWNMRGKFCWHLTLAVSVMLIFFSLFLVLKQYIIPDVTIKYILGLTLM